LKYNKNHLAAQVSARRQIVSNMSLTAKQAARDRITPLRSPDAISKETFTKLVGGSEQRAVSFAAFMEYVNLLIGGEE